MVTWKRAVKVTNVTNSAEKGDLKNKQKHQWFAFCFIIARNDDLCVDSCFTKKQDDIS